MRASPFTTGKRHALLIAVAASVCAAPSCLNASEAPAIDEPAAAVPGDFPYTAPPAAPPHLEDSEAPGTDEAMVAAAPSDLPYAAPPAAPGALPARTWKLSHAEYARAVLDFVGAKVDTSALEGELDNGVYPSMSSSGLVRATLARDYFESAQRIADGLSAEQLAPLAGAGPLDAASKQPFLERAIRRAFRRAPTSEDLAAYGEIFELGALEGELGSFRAVVRALLGSPFFLYRTELGSDASTPTFELTGYELASLVSFSLTSGPPSESLLAAAERGELSQPESLATHVRALLATPEAERTLETFALQWLKLHHFDELAKVPDLFLGFEALRPAMVDEARALLADSGGLSSTLTSLLTSPLEPAGALGEYYASESSSGGSPGTRVGVLGLGAVIAARSKGNASSPTLRGLFVRERFLCQEIHLPADLPPDLTQTLLRSLPRTTRELYEQHATNPSCASCHSLLDSIGWSFEDLDGGARFRTLENGVPIDTHGELVNSDVSGPIASHGELAQRLARSDWVRECVARQVFRFYFGQVEADRGLPAIQAARAEISHGTLRDVVAALMTTASTARRERR